ncbi:MAG: superoxide dismutase [Pseudomonadota bacterium]
MTLSRRSFIIASAAALAPLAMPSIVRAGDSAKGPFSQSKLTYDFNALEPHIDTKTMATHYGKHHAGYVRGINKAVAAHSELQGKSLVEILKGLDTAPASAQRAIRTAGGGHANHDMFWSIMGPNGGGEPIGDLADAIGSAFGSFKDFKAKFEKAGKGQFGSGWVFVTMEGDTLNIVSKPNQVSPLMEGKPVVMGNDVWEHAYYLKYQNRRGDYLDAWWNTVNWDAVGERFARIKDGALI